MASKPSLEVRLRALSAIDYAPGDTITARIKHVSQQSFKDSASEMTYRFTWRTLSTWLYRFKRNGITTMESKTRADKNSYRKVTVNQLAEAINEVLPTLSNNKSGIVPRSVMYRAMLQRGLFNRLQIAPTTFYRMIKQHNLLDEETVKRQRQSFAMKFVNEMWQADTMYGPTIKMPDGKLRKTFLIAFIDDASRVIAHAQFFFRDNTENMITAFQTAIYKRGKPERLYFDNGSNYKSKEILQACLRLDIHLSHAPIRDGAAKGKIERFFRGFRDRFLTQHLEFSSLSQLNALTQAWIENEYNQQYHGGIQMKPIDRFNIDIKRVKYLTDDAFSREVFFFEENRKVSKTNCFSINSQSFECPVDLREKSVQVRYDREQRNAFIVYYNDQRMGEASRLDLYANAQQRSPFADLDDLDSTEVTYD